MTSKKVTIKGRGPEMFGRGIDLLFGEALATTGEHRRGQADGQPAIPTGTAERLSRCRSVAAAAGPAREASLPGCEAASASLRLPPSTNTCAWRPRPFSWSSRIARDQRNSQPHAQFNESRPGGSASRDGDDTGATPSVVRSWSRRSAHRSSCLLNASSACAARSRGYHYAYTNPDNPAACRRASAGSPPEDAQAQAGGGAFQQWQGWRGRRGLSAETCRKEDDGADPARSQGNPEQAAAQRLERAGPGSRRALREGRHAAQRPIVRRPRSPLISCAGCD